MHIGQAILYGALQGISEFLPISSSGHIVLLQRLWQVNAPPLLLDVSLHTGTLAALVFAFRKDLIDLVRHPRDPLWRHLLAGTVPTVAIALWFQPWIETAFATGQMLGAEFLLTGLLLLLAETRSGLYSGRIGLSQAFLIGCAQGAAILPALSRSGLTMSAAIGLGVKREEAVRFSFLLSIPALLGATMFAFKNAGSTLQQVFTPMLLLAVLISALTGYLAIRFLLKWVSRHSVRPFGYYTVGLGVLLLLNQWWWHLF